MKCEKRSIFILLYVITYLKKKASVWRVDRCIWNWTCIHDKKKEKEKTAMLVFILMCVRICVRFNVRAYMMKLKKNKK
jgi:hypothetical protein